jgi:queuine tRNA-ribosyltransferase
MKNKKWEADFSALDEMGITWVDTEYTINIYQYA